MEKQSKKHSVKARIDKKRATKRKKQQDHGLHATSSFISLVNKSNLTALEKYVGGQVQHLGQELTVTVHNLLRPIQLRMMALERIFMNKFDVSEDEIAHNIADLEDESARLKSVQESPKEGDQVRFQLASKLSQEEEFGERQRLKVKLHKGTTGLGEDVEQALFSMKAGEEKEVLVEEDSTKMLCKIFVERVSRPRDTSNEGKKLSKKEQMQQDVTGA